MKVGKRDSHPRKGEDSRKRDGLPFAECVKRSKSDVAIPGEKTGGFSPIEGVENGREGDQRREKVIPRSIKSNPHRRRSGTSLAPKKGKKHGPPLVPKRGKPAPVRDCRG